MFINQNISAITRSGSDDFWFQPVGAISSTGVRVSPESAMSLSVLYSCVKVLSETVGQLPLFLYKRLDEKGKEKATKHPLYRVLHQQPNSWQTSQEWRQLMMVWLALRGNAYNRIVTSFNGQVEQLIPIHPDTVKIELLDSGSFRYKVKEKNGTEKTYNRGEIMHLRGLSSDGILGLNPIEAHREMIGLGLTLQDYATKFYANDATPGGVLEYPGKFKSDDDRKKFRAAWQAAQTGKHRNKTAVLEDGMKFVATKVKNKDAQFLETLKNRDIEICRIYRMPPHKVAILDRATFSNIEHQSIEFVVDTIMPWLKVFEHAITRDLITQENTFFAEFLVDGLLRGDIQSRYDAYNSAITTGWMTRAEARDKENMNPIDGLDKPLEQLNMTPAGEREKELTRNAAQVLVKREIQSIKGALSKPDEFNAWLDDFYGSYAEKVTRILVTDPVKARAYCEKSKKVINTFHNDNLLSESVLDSLHIAKLTELTKMEKAA